MPRARGMAFRSARKHPPGATASAWRYPMHPGVFGFWRARHGYGCGGGGGGDEGCGPQAAHFGWHGHHGPSGPHHGPFGGGGGGGDDFGGGGFGVRRPLRFLAYKLE